jgi:hypothetical protein
MPARRPDGELITSSRQPIYVWNDFVSAALQGRSGAAQFPVPPGIVFHQMDLKSGALDPGGVRAAFRESDDLTQQALGQSVLLSLPIDTATGLRATVDTPPDRIQIIEVDPSDVSQYLQGAGGGG